MSTVCPLCHTDTDAANGNSSVPEEGVEPPSDTTQNTSEIEHYNQPAEGEDEESEAFDETETKEEQKHNVDQSEEERDNNSKEAVQPQHQQEAVPDQEEAQQEGDASRDSAEEDTEQVETFFSTMSHRYENATQEGHIL